MVQASEMADPCELLIRRKRQRRRFIISIFILGLIALAICGLAWLNQGECMRALFATSDSPLEQVHGLSGESEGD